MIKKIFYFIIFSLLFTLNVNCEEIDIDTKISQLIIIGFDGDNVNSSGFKKMLSQINDISGVILFSKNIKSKDDLILMNEKIIAESKIKPFIALDNEGGQIQRYNFENHPSALEVSKMTNKEAHLEYAKMAQITKELKFNLNFAPCVDLDLNPDSIIRKKQRSYGDDYKIVSKYARIFIDEHNSRQIATSIKHFPGHGSVKGDTHKGFVDSTTTFSKDEIMPYISLKNLDKLNMVMVSHIYNSNFDKIYPASLSKSTVNMLIEGIGFDGVIVSDDYDMRAIRDNYSLRDIIVRAIGAKINILIFSNNIASKDRKIVSKIHKIIKEEIEKGNIKQEDIDNSYKKVMALKALL